MSKLKNTERNENILKNETKESRCAAEAQKNEKKEQKNTHMLKN